MSFGKFIKEQRLKKDLSLRAFCLQAQEDPSNWSKVERDLIAPHQNDNKLTRIAEVLALSMNDERQHLFDLARISAGHFPDSVMADKELLEMLPVFFRTVENVKPTREELLEFVEQLKQK